MYTALLFTCCESKVESTFTLAIDHIPTCVGFNNVVVMHVRRSPCMPVLSQRTNAELHVLSVAVHCPYLTQLHQMGWCVLWSKVLDYCTCLLCIYIASAVTGHGHKYNGVAIEVYKTMRNLVVFDLIFSLHLKPLMSASVTTSLQNLVCLFMVN